MSLMRGIPFTPPLLLILIEINGIQILFGYTDGGDEFDFKIYKILMDQVRVKNKIHSHPHVSDGSSEWLPLVWELAFHILFRLYSTAPNTATHGEYRHPVSEMQMNPNQSLAGGLTRIGVPTP